MNDRSPPPSGAVRPGDAPPRRTTRRLAPDEAGLAKAAAILRGGGLVAFPTETVYGLGADATDGRAVAGIYAAKERPSFNPLIAHVADVRTAQEMAVFNDDARSLAEAFWPGPLTLVVPRSPVCRVADLALAGLDSVALRVPAHPLARALLARVGRPVAAPSANRSGRVSPTDAAHVMADLDGRIDAVLDGGATPVGVESTIVACLDGPPVLLRPGGVSREEIERVLGTALAAPAVSAAEQAPLAPGMLASHYAPRARVRLDARDIRTGEAALTFGNARPAGLETAVRAINLSEAGSLAEAAATLFAALRTLDETGATTIAVTPVPELGLGEAINDRLRRAAAPR